jgi:hypothetical protein
VIHDGKLKFVGTPKALKSKVGADYLERAFLTIIEGGSDNVAVRKTSTTKSTAKRSKESSS